MVACMSDVLIVGGSPSESSRSAAMLRLVEQWVRESGLLTRVVSIRELPAEALVRGDADAPGIRESVNALATARGVVIGTPIYKAAYSGLLKIWLDLLPQYALAGKTVLPLATGGSIAHVLAIDYALRPVLSALGARHVVPGYFVLESLAQKQDDGSVVLAAEVDVPLRQIVAEFVGAVR